MKKSKGLTTKTQRHREKHNGYAARAHSNKAFSFPESLIAARLLEKFLLWTTVDSCCVIFSVPLRLCGSRGLEISQTMTVLRDATPNVLAAPPNTRILQACTTFRRAFGESMPQPKPGNGGGDFDVVARGVIGSDGKVHDAVVQSSERPPDLNAEAVSLVERWVFTPALCNGRPVVPEASFTLHFQAR